MEEEWRPVVGFEGFYEVSNRGNVRSLCNYRPAFNGRLMKLWKGNKNYRYVTFRMRPEDTKRKTFAVHRLVLDAFVGPRPAGKEAAHWNGDPTDNRVENLRWASSKENHADRIRHGRTTKGEDNHCAKLDRGCVKTIRKLRGLVSGYELARLACVTPSTITDIWEHKIWKHV